MKNIFSILLFACLPFMVFAQNPNLGAVGGQFLKLPVTADGISMSGAILTSVKGASSVFWNPAGVSMITRSSFEATSQYGKWQDFFNLNTFSFGVSLTPSSAIALSGILLTMDKMEVTDEFNPNGTGQNFDAQDLALGLTYGRYVSQQFRVGLTGKIIRQRIWNEVASGVALDIGTQYDISWRKMTLAMSMMNFGPEMKFDGPDLDITHDADRTFPNRIVTGRKSTEEFPLPLSFTFGVGINLIDGKGVKLRTEMNAIHPNDNDERIHIGSELNLGNRLMLRGGYKITKDDKRISDNYSMGLGVKTPFSGTNLGIDIGYVSNKYLSDIILYSVKVDL